MAALETSSIIPVLLEVGQSPNAFFVNVTKCKPTAAAALLYPFSHAQPHKSPPHLLFTRLKFDSPGNGFQKDTSGPASYRFRQYPSPFRPGWMRSGEKGMGSGCNISSLNQSSYFCLSFLTALLSSWRRPMLKFTPRPKNYLPSILPPFPSLCPSASTCYTISPHVVPGMDLSSVMMMEVTLNMSAASVTDSGAALSTYKGQNDWERMKHYSFGG